ncbi:MAG: STAS domain-containing protein [bacterium]
MNIIRRKEILLDILEIQGRIDGLTAPEIKRAFDRSVNEGHRQLIVDFRDVTYLSSAGLRIILETHKSLKTIGGELILLSIPQTVADVFRVSGMAPLLNIFADMVSLRRHLNEAPGPDTGTRAEYNGISFEMISIPGDPGNLTLIGSPDKMAESAYTSADMSKVTQSEFRFGAGLGVTGDTYPDIRDLFGESIILNHHFFSYPAVRKPIVDYSYYSEELSRSINFMHGFGMNGKYSRILRFETTGEQLTLDALAKAAGNVASSPMFGIVILALSGGILGMHLKKSPVSENRPARQGIMEPENFHDWISYPLEEEGLHKTVVAAGIVIKDRGSVNPEWLNQLPRGADLHVHAALFENGLWSNNLGEFEHELERVLREFEVEKVVHLLPESLLLNGFMGIINLNP